MKINNSNNNDNNLANADKIFGFGNYEREQVSIYTGTTRGNIDAIRLSVAVQVAAVGFILYWLGGFLAKFGAFDFPYNIIAGFYHFAVNIPVKTFGGVWGWLDGLNITPYNNLNLVLAVIGTAFYAIVVLGLYSYAIGVFKRKMDLDGLGVVFAFALPAFAALLWFIASVLLRWLFH